MQQAPNRSVAAPLALATRAAGNWKVRRINVSDYEFDARFRVASFLLLWCCDDFRIRRQRIAQRRMYELSSSLSFAMAGIILIYAHLSPARRKLSFVRSISLRSTLQPSNHQVCEQDGSGKQTRVLTFANYAHHQRKRNSIVCGCWLRCLDTELQYILFPGLRTCHIALVNL